MKQFLSFILTLGLLFSMAACHQDAAEPQGAALYYRLAESDYSTGSAALSAEYRTDVPRDSLTQALKMYLNGPKSSDLQSPFPEGMKLIGAYQEGSTVYLTLSRELSDMTGLELTIACGCLTLTTLALTDAEQVQIQAVSGLLDGQGAITMDKNTLLLLDTAGEGE